MKMRKVLLNIFIWIVKLIKYSKYSTDNMFCDLWSNYEYFLKN